VAGEKGSHVYIHKTPKGRIYYLLSVSLVKESRRKKNGTSEPV